MGLLGAIEAGGTKFVVAVADHNYNIVERTAFPTLDGQKTLDQVIRFLISSIILMQLVLLPLAQLILLSSLKHMGMFWPLQKQVGLGITFWDE